METQKDTFTAILYQVSLFEQVGKRFFFFPFFLPQSAENGNNFRVEE